MQITRRQFGLAMIFGFITLALSRIFGSFLGFGRSGEGDNVRPARYWRSSDSLGG